MVRCVLFNVAELCCVIIVVMCLCLMCNVSVLFVDIVPNCVMVCVVVVLVGVSG